MDSIWKVNPSNSGFAEEIPRIASSAGRMTGPLQQALVESEATTAPAKDPVLCALNFLKKL